MGFLDELDEVIRIDTQKIIKILEQEAKEEEQMLDELKLILTKKLDNAKTDLINTPSISVKKNILKGQIDAYVDVLATIKMLEDKNNDK